MCWHSVGNQWWCRVVKKLRSAKASEKLSPKREGMGEGRSGFFKEEEGTTVQQGHGFHFSFATTFMQHDAQAPIDIRIELALTDDWLTLNEGSPKRASL